MRWGLFYLQITLIGFLIQQSNIFACRSAGKVADIQLCLHQKLFFVLRKDRRGFNIFIVTNIIVSRFIITWVCFADFLCLNFRLQRV